jgi:hypothetical protein
MVELINSELLSAIACGDLGGVTGLANEDAEAAPWNRPHLGFSVYDWRSDGSFADEMFSGNCTRDITKNSSRAFQNKLDLG